MRKAYQVICHIISLCVVIQAAVIAWSTFAMLGSSSDGAAISVDDGLTGFIVHSVVGQMVIPLLAIVLLVLALIGRIGVKWAAWVLVAVVVQVALGFTSFDLPGLGLLHGINAFVILGLAEMGARSVAVQKVPTPAAERTATDDSA